LVNDLALLEPRSFVPSRGGDYVVAGRSELEVLGHGRRVMKKSLARKKSHNTEDLILEDVAVVEEFHVNLISEKKLKELKIW
jgi:hypothetical protein